MSRLAENLALLRRNDPNLAARLEGWEGGQDLEVLGARSGWPTVRRRGGDGALFVHSSVDPWREARRLVEDAEPAAADVVVVLGAGLGYHLLALADRRPACPVIVVEKDHGMVRLAMDNLDLRPLLERDNVYWVLGDDPDKLQLSLGRAFDYHRLRKVAVLEHPGSVRLDPAFYRRMRRRVLDAVNLMVVNLVTVLQHGGQWLRNSILNLPAVAENPGIGELFGRFAGRPAIIISAGPSLDKNVDLLREAKGKALLLCVDTALKAVLRRGIHPDFVFSLDGCDLNYRHFEGIDVDDVRLVAEPMTHHKIVETFRGPVLIASFGSPLIRWVESFTGEKGELFVGGSVATMAFAAAIKFGADPIIFVGQDLSYPGGRYYAQGTFYEENGWKFAFAEKDLIEVPALDGGKVVTNRGMYNFLRWFEAAIQKFPDRTFIDATEGGALIAGTRVMSLREAIDAYCRQDIPVAGVLEGIARPVCDRAGLRREMQKTRERLKEIARLGRRAERLSAGLAAGRRGSRDIDRILRVLAAIDRKLLSRKNEMVLLQALLQPVLFPLLRALEEEAAEESPANTAARRIAERSQTLYRGIGAAAEEAERLMGQALERLGGAAAGGVNADERPA